MLQKLFIVYFLLQFIQVDIKAQDQSLMQNPDIIWLAETNFEYILENGESNYIDYEMNTIDSYPQNATSILYKMDVVQDDLPFPNNQLASWIRHVISLDSSMIKSVKSGEKLSKEEVGYIMYGIELDTLKDKGTIPLTSYSLVSFYSFYIKQVWFYDKSRKRLYSKVIEITPVVLINDDNKRKLFTIEVKQIHSMDSLGDFSHSAIKWVVHNEMKLNFKKAFNCIKGSNDIFFNDYLMNAEYHCGKNDQIYANTRCNKLQAYKENRLSFLKPTLKDKEEAKRVILINEIRGIQIEQLFYINSSSNEFGVYVKEISPLVKYEFKDDFPPLYQSVWSIKND